MTTYTNKPAGVSDAELDEMFNALVAGADAAKAAYIATRVQPVYAAMYTQFAAANTPAAIANGASVVVHSAADANVSGSPGTAVVSAGVLTKVMLTV